MRASFIAIDKAASGILIANNIFYIEGKIQLVKGDQYKPEKDGAFVADNIVFENNLFLTENSWLKSIPIQDINPIYGDPEFQNIGGTEVENYMPKNLELVSDKGIEIKLIPNDTNGLFIGLDVEKDINGKRINGKIGIGAINTN